MHSVSGKYPTNLKSHLKNDNPEEFKALKKRLIWNRYDRTIIHKVILNWAKSTM